MTSGWLTGNLSLPPTEFVCRRLFIPSDPDILAAVNGALLALTREYNWQKFGTMTPEETAELMSIMWGEYAQSEACMIGTIVSYATAIAPSGILPCDGSTYARADYPRLFAALDALYIVDADNFTVPDLRGRMIVGSGAGTGLTSRDIGDEGGEEQHTLTEGELASHRHSLNAAFSLNPVNTGSPDTTLIQSVIAVEETNDTGGNEPHENMPPYLVLHYGIVAR